MHNPHWWQTAVIYQIYPRSFQDSNGDGVGDLRGIIRRLPHLVDLGVDALWLSPIYPSPMADFGYDISDYTGVDPVFGDIADFDALVEAAHAANLRVILDLVPNHTSDQHPWFVESRSSRANAKRDWYIWRDPAPDGGPPNNWLSVFGGGAWEFDARQRAILLPRLPRGAAGPQLAQPGSPRRHLRRHALLAAARGRRFSHRRDLASHQGRPVSRQSRQSRVQAGRSALPRADPALHGGQGRGAWGHRRDARMPSKTSRKRC